MTRRILRSLALAALATACTGKQSGQAGVAGRQRQPRPVAAQDAGQTPPSEAAAPTAEAADVDTQLREAARPEALTATADPMPDPPAALAVQEVGLRVTRPGAEPRRVLARTPAKGHTQKLTISLGMKVAMQLGRQAVPAADVPPLAVDVDVTVDRIGPDGTNYSFAVTDVRVGDVSGVSERVQKAVLESAVSLTKLAGKGRLADDAGAPELNLPGDADPALEPALESFRDSFAQLLVALPEDPVGTGATWQVVRDADIQGFPIQQTATYTVTALGEDTVDLDVAFIEAGVDRPTKEAPDAKARTRGHVAKGTGKVTVDLGQLMPTKAAVVSNATTHATLTIAGAPQDVLMKVGLDTRVGD